MKKLKSAAIAIIIDHNQILLTERHDVPIWVLPGGGIEVDETPEQAVVREVFEETGYIVKIERQSGEYTPLNRLAAPTFVFVCSVISGNGQICHESRDMRFFELQSLPKNFFVIHRDWLLDAFANKGIVKKTIPVTYFRTFLYLLRHPFNTLRFLWTRIRKN